MEVIGGFHVAGAGADMYVVALTGRSILWQGAPASIPFDFVSRDLSVPGRSVLVAKDDDGSSG